MNEHLVVIKLGGGVLTDKTKLSTAIRHDRLAFVASEVARIHKTQAVDVLLGTGAGSYGHFLAHKYDIAKGTKTKKQFFGMSATHNEVRRLSLRVADELVAKDVPAFAVSPASMITCAGGAVKHVYIDSLRILLRNHCIPIVHGDTIPDETLGSYILSTEKVFNACLTQLKPSYKRITVIYVMNEDGVLDQSGKVIPLLSGDDEVLVSIRTAHDISGGIIGKVHGARAALQFADDVYILGCNKRGSIQKAIRGQQVGTKVTA